jgi:L-fuculose-phosphate aldolase
MAEEYVGRKFETVFVGGPAPDRAAADEIIRAGVRLDSMGLTPDNAGNISVRRSEGMLITVGGVNKGAMAPGDVVEVVDFDFLKAKVCGLKEPSSETPMHWLIYKTFPLAKAVIHVHDDLALQYAGKLKLSLGVHSTSGELHYGTSDQAFEVVKALEHAQYAIIRGHGIVCMGGTLDEAMGLIVGIHQKLKAMH